MFGEIVTDSVTDTCDLTGTKYIAVEYLPGQFDQRADSAIQCVKFLREDEQPVIKTAVAYLITGDISDDEFERIKGYCIKPGRFQGNGYGKRIHW